MKKMLTSFLMMLMCLKTVPLFCLAELDSNSISAASAVVICADNGRVLFEKNAYEKRPMASTTKIMTSLLALESAEADDKFVTITDKMVPVEGSSMGLEIGNTLPNSRHIEEPSTGTI